MDAGAWIRAARRARRLSQRELAAAVGMPPSSIARLESGRHTPRLETFIALLGAAGFALVAVDDKNRVLVRDDEHERIRDRGGRHFPAHLQWAGKPDYMGEPRWWGWHNIAWYWPDDPAVPDHVYYHRQRYRGRWDDAT